ncbi:MAG: hypothetical protein HYX41_03585 [Bdellovibrio sp.]|nr:hypothetical protein [Bdellovibrio sp.]
MSKQKSMHKPPQRPRGFLGGLIVSLLGLGVLFLGMAAQGPDLDMKFVREIPSKLSPERLEYNISSTTRWPQWFYSVANVKVLNPQSPSEQAYTITEGSRLSFQMDPGKGLHKKFELIAKVIKYVPGKVLSLEVEGDSTHRLSSIFEKITWTIHLVPNPNGKELGTLIRGEASAKTRHWRSRLLGRIAERVVMNQIFYPNLIKLAELRQPFSADSPLEQDRNSLWK